MLILVNRKSCKKSDKNEALADNKHKYIFDNQYWSVLEEKKRKKRKEQRRKEGKSSRMLHDVQYSVIKIRLFDMK